MNTCKQIPFEFILVKTQALENVPADLDSFADYFEQGKNVVSFWNLGRDAKLVAPCPLKDKDVSIYAHFAEFARNADNEQVCDFIKESANQMLSILNSNPSRRTWLSTSGTGIYWLHMRLDSYPKYYTYMPYSK